MKYYFSGKHDFTGVDKILYEAAFNFSMKYCGGDEAKAHQAGLDKLKSVEKLKEELDKPQIFVDLSTGKTFISTEAKMSSL